MTTRSDNYQGILWMLLAMAGFAFEDVFVKALARDLPTSEILIGLGLGGTVVFGALVLRRGDRLFGTGLFTPPMILRNLGEMLGTLCFISALTLIPLSTATAILQAMPLVVMAGAALFLGETVGWRRWSAIAVGFCGVLLIIRPGMEGFEFTALWAVGATIFLAIRDLATRVIPKTVTPSQMGCWGFFMAMIAGVVLLPFGPAPVTLAPIHGVYFIGALAVGMAGYSALTLAMRSGDVGVVTPFRYSRLLFSIILGMVLFAENPDGLTLLGAALILASGLYALARGNKTTAKAAV